MGGLEDETLDARPPLADTFDAEDRSPPRRRVGQVPERGDLVGRHTVLSKLGAGAMGVVLAAYDPELDRKVALKLLELRDTDQGAVRQRLQREAQALTKLNHPKVVAVHDVGEHDGQVLVAMELVPGRTLGEWMAEARRPRREQNEVNNAIYIAEIVGD